MTQTQIIQKVLQDSGNWIPSWWFLSGKFAEYKVKSELEQSKLL